MTIAARSLALVMCGIVLATAMMASAQDSGPLRFSIETAIEHTDNRDGTETGENNTDMFLKPRIDMDMQLARTVLDLYYVPTYRYRSDPNIIQHETELQHDLSANCEHKPLPYLSLILNEHLNVTDDPAVQKSGSTLRRDSSFLLNRAETGLDYALSRRLTLGWRLRHMMKRYEEKSRKEESDQDALGSTLKAWRQVSRMLAIFAKLDYQDVEYDDTPGAKRGFHSSAGAFGVKKIFTRNFVANALVGWTTLNYDALGVDSDTLPVFNLTCETATAPSTRIMGGITYGSRAADAYPFSSQKSTDINTKLEWDASKDMMLGVAVTYRIGEYDMETVPTSLLLTMYQMYLNDDILLPKWAHDLFRSRQTTGEEKVLIATLSATYKIDVSTSIKLVQRLEDVNSDVSTSFDRNSTTLSLSKQF